MDSQLNQPIILSKYNVYYFTSLIKNSSYLSKSLKSFFILNNTSFNIASGFPYKKLNCNENIYESYDTVYAVNICV